MKKLSRYFTKGELALWGISAGLIVVSFLLFDRVNGMTLAASLIGVTSLIFNAKGNPIGQGLMILFSLLYGAISYTFSYFGEMITYLGMTGPMALFALISWLRNPYRGNHAEVAVNRLSLRELALVCGLTAAVTCGFYFILEYFRTANMIPSTLSVTTSFLAVYLTFRRSPYFALAYDNTRYIAMGELMVAKTAILVLYRLGVNAKPVVIHKSHTPQNTQFDCAKLKPGITLNAMLRNRCTTKSPQPKSSIPYSIKLFG